MTIPVILLNFIELSLFYNRCLYECMSTYIYTYFIHCCGLHSGSYSSSNENASCIKFFTGFVTTVLPI